MTKRKNAIALFDLISKGKTQGTTTGMNVPGWFSKRPATPPPIPPQEEQAQMPAATSPAPPPPQPPRSPFASSASPGEPLISVADGRVKFSLNYVTCAVTAMGVLAVLGILFWLGRVTAHPTPPVANAPTDNRPIPPGTRSGGVSNDPNVMAAFLSVPRTKGKYYLIIDRMRGATDEYKLDAVAVYEYCQKNGYLCTAVNTQDGGFAVLSLKSFDSPTSREALAYAREIETLGGKYKPPPGRNKYTFSQERDRKLDPSYYKWPE